MTYHLSIEENSPEFRTSHPVRLVGTLIDIHAHILPGLDDGPKTIEESIEMCKAAHKDGVSTVIATPHTLNGLYLNEKSTILAKVQEVNEAFLQSYGFDPKPGFKILPGADVYFCPDLLELYEQGKIQTVNDNGHYMMIEFFHLGIPYKAEDVLSQLMAKGVVPIITHPERNFEIDRDPRRYYEMVRMGCLGQVTAMSLTGGFGRRAKEISEKLLSHRLIHFIASDTHSVSKRPPILSHALKVAEGLVGKEESRRMVTEYPQAVILGSKPEVPEPIRFDRS